MNIINIISLACLGLIIFGFCLGFFRSLKKSMTRFIMLTISLIVAIIMAPVLANYLVNTFVTGYSFNGFGLNIDFKELVKGMTSTENLISEIFSIKATENLVASIMTLAISVSSFFVIFSGCMILTLIVFWIAFLIIHLVNRKKMDYEQKRAKNKSIAYRFAGGVFGILSSVVLCFLISVPVFGIMNICDQFLVEQQSENVNAVNANNLVSGQLFYKEDSSIGSVEGYVEKYAHLKKEIDDSVLGKITNTLGISTLGKTTFDYVTTVEQNGLKLSLTNEIVTVIKVYNSYKAGFIENQLNLADKQSVDKSLDSIELIYQQANNSTIVKSYLIELIPKFREKWIAGETYLGIEFPVKGEYEDLALIIIDKGFDTYSLTEINNNVEALIDVARIANESNLIQAINDNIDIFEFIKKDDTNLIKNIFIELSQSKFGNALPELIENVVKIAYDLAINTDDILTKEEINNIFSDVDNDLPDTIDWNVEGENLQKLIQSIFGIVDVFYNNESDADVIINNIDRLGIVIENARKSVFSNHFKLLVEEMIDNKIDSDILGTDVMNVLKAKLKSNWNNNDFDFESMFKTLKQTALLAQNLTINSDNMSSQNLDNIMNNLETVVSGVISNEQTKETLKDIINKNVIEGFIPEEYTDTIDVVKDMVVSFIDNTNTETIKEDIAAGKEIINIVNISVNSGEFSLIDDLLTKEQKAEEIVKILTNSDAIMKVIDIANDQENSSNELQQMAKNIEGEDINILKEAIRNFNIENEEVEEQTKLAANKSALMKLFGIEA